VENIRTHLEERGSEVVNWIHQDQDKDQ